MCGCVCVYVCVCAMYACVLGDITHTWKTMLSGVPSWLVSVMSWMALTAITTCPIVYTMDRYTMVLHREREFMRMSLSIHHFIFKSIQSYSQVSEVSYLQAMEDNTDHLALFK